MTTPYTTTAAVLAAALLSATAPAAAQAPEPKLGPDVAAGTALADVQPAGPAPDWAPDIDPQMHAVVEQLLATEPGPGFAKLTPFQVRNAVLPKEAAVELMTKAGIPASEPKTDIAHRVLPVGPEGGVLIRTYTPLDAGDGPLPVIVYYHGGGWVIADLDTYEPSARALAAKTGAIVASVAYRQAPEYTFPTAHEDSYAAYEWITRHADSLGGDPARIATAGESAGGNLAVAVAMMARDRGARLPDHILSVYPVADGDVESTSYDEYAKAVPLSKPFMEWFFDEYTPEWRTIEEPLIGLVDADLTGLPPVTIVNAQIDPLLADGEELAERFERAGVDVERRVYDGVTHEFFGMAALLEQADEAQDFAAERLRAAFDAAAASAPAEATGPGESTGMNDAGGADTDGTTRLPGMTTTSGLRGPESFIYDDVYARYLVTNINGQPGERDDNGFISILEPATGGVAALKWIDGAERNLTLHAPKGMAFHDDRLYVADIVGVHAFDRASGAYLDTWETPDAQFLNCVAVDEAGNVYATDSGIEFTSEGPVPMGESKVYMFTPTGERSVLAAGEGVAGANGIVAHPEGGVVVASILSDEVIRVEADGSTEVAGEMPAGMLDGLVRLPDGSHLVSSWAGEAIYRLAPDGAVSTVFEGISSPADFHVDPVAMRLLVPQLMANQVRVLPWAEAVGE